ncbi:glycoside hydrolase family 104 protein [Limnohabitans sp.]|uniref:glycoside hydrolase family 24 protein n=1 Tax=Limnohabitans sp. TaxID=1907725 RepID=UPI00286EFA42|nr:glycoside hydrolase family 104 protein [Limnohabitans sp.]
MKWLIPTACIAVAGALFYRAINYVPQSDPGQPLDDSANQETNFLQDMMNNVSTDAPQVSDTVADKNRRAFLDMIAYSEGTSGPSGYLTMFGGRLMDSLEVHPHQYFTFTNSRGEQLKTSAAGRYQFLGKTWDSLAAKLGLPDFSPESQDAAALELIRQRGALPDVDAGRLAVAVQKCAPIWASLPGAGYAQPERKLSQLAAAFADAGGMIVSA